MQRGGNDEENFLSIHLRTRYMDPSTGSFITMDEYAGSIFDPANLHKYLYVNGNPINAHDPTGYFMMMSSMMSTIQDSDTQMCQLVNYLGILDKINLALTFYDMSMSFYYAMVSGGTLKEVACAMARGFITSIAINFVV